MTELRELLNIMVNAGISEDAAADFILQETGENPIKLESAEVIVTLQITVELDKYELENLTEDDEKDIADLAEAEVMNSIVLPYAVTVEAVEVWNVETN